MEKTLIQVKNVLLGAGIPKICVPLTGCSRTELLEEVRAVKETGPDLVEWRADFFKELKNPVSVRAMLEALQQELEEIPLLFTVRTLQEGGEARLTVSEYCDIIENAVLARPDLTDVEAFGEFPRKKQLIRYLQEKGSVVIASSHDFTKTDSCERLLEKFAQMESSGGDILKIAVMPKDFSDVTALLNATYEMNRRSDKLLISIAMGSLGMITRIAGEVSGSVLTFGSGRHASAPGQLPVKELRYVLKSLHTEDPTDK